ncbi:Zn-ribbon domain-containing OB-fold protein [Streptomyces sp. NPDC048584]|uniref:Zn-ribbon domain-containing OB-fold protein n=1 Tax=Streptomyces sp. NPDC048584 TaxID=3365573 RepID=UPI00371B2555
MHEHTEETSAPAPGAASGPARAEASAAKTLYFQRCTWCGTTVYRRILCPACRSTDLRVEPSTGTGTVRRSRTILGHASSARNESLIELAEGFVVRGRVMGMAVGIPAGARVQLVAVKDTIRMEPVFRLLDA